MLAVFSAPSSGFRWTKLYNSAHQQVFIDAHNIFFNEVTGVYKTVVYDNMRNVIKKFVGRNTKKLNNELVKLALFYGFTPVVANTFSGNEKGHVEQSVKHVRKKAFTKVYAFDSLELAQEHLDHTLFALNQSNQIEEETPCLTKKFSDFEHSKINSFISLGRNFYSVPDYLVGKQVTVKKYLNVLRVVYQGNFTYQYSLLLGNGQHQIEIKHYLKTLSKKPKALEHSLALQIIPELNPCFQMHYQIDPKHFIQLIERHKEADVLDIIDYLKQDYHLRVQGNKSVKSTRVITASRVRI